MITRRVLFLFLLVGSLGSLTAQTDADKILGTWENPQHDAHMEIYEEGGKYFGKVVWLKEPLNPQGNPKKDKNNPERTLRDREIVGMVLLSKLSFNKVKYEGGTIYTPERGMSLSCKAHVASSNELNLTVTKGIFSKKVTWTRVK